MIKKHVKKFDVRSHVTQELKEINFIHYEDLIMLNRLKNVVFPCKEMHDKV